MARPLHEGQQGRPIEGRAVVEPHLEGPLPSSGAPLDGRGRPPEARSEEGVEAADAGEARGEGHLGEGQRGVLEEPLGQGQPVGLGELHGADPQLRLERPAQVAGGDPELGGEGVHRAPVEGPGADESRGPARQRGDGLRGGVPRGQLGPAPEAGPVARPLGLRGAAEELAPRPRGGPGGADGAAVDPRALDPDEEHPVEASISRLEGGKTCVCVQRSHGRCIARALRGRWPFSDLAGDSGGRRRNPPLT